VLVLSGAKDGSDAGDRYRRLLPDCHFMFVYDAGRAIGAERPEALAFIALEFFERSISSSSAGKAAWLFLAGCGAENSQSSALRRFRTMADLAADLVRSGHQLPQRHAQLHSYSTDDARCGLANGPRW
jgi:hypothetical protein